MQLKRIISLLCVAVLIVTGMALPLYAAEYESFEVGVEVGTGTPISANPLIYKNGDEITVRISAKENTGVTFLCFELCYDAEAVEYISNTDAMLFGKKSVIMPGDGYLMYFMYATAETLEGEGLLFEATFRATEAYHGDTTFSVQLLDNDSANCSKYQNISHNSNVPFIGDDLTLGIHNIVDEEGIVTAPTCTEQGYTTYSCSYFEGKEEVTHDVIGNYTDALGHIVMDAVEENRVDATCTENGSYDAVVYCERCDVEINRETVVLPALGHVLEFVDAKAATCTDIGWDAYEYCTVCDYTTYNELPALGHVRGESVVENRVKATCTEDGSYDKVYYCVVCGAEESRRTIVTEAKGHTIVEIDAKDATCTEIGWNAYRICEECDYTTYEEIPVLGHIEAEPITENEIEPTCTQTGSYDIVVYCSVCNAELSRETMAVKAKGHTLVDHDAKAAACTEIGWNAYQTCEVCDFTTYEEIPALGHIAAEATIENAVEPTCTQAGSYECVVYCSVCNVELTRETVVVEAKGHTEGEWKTTVHPTYKSEGEKTMYCSVCGEAVTTEVIEMLEELPFEDVAVDAWYYDAVEYCHYRGYINGVTPTTFNPSGNLTREQFVLILANLAGADLTEYAEKVSPFLDVKPGAWYSAAINWAYENGYTGGVSETAFGVGMNVTREQLARFFYVFAEKNGIDVSGRADLSSYTDAATISSWATECAEWAVDAGLISGMTPTTINPRGFATRAQAARMFMVFDSVRQV